MTDWQDESVRVGPPVARPVCSCHGEPMRPAGRQAAPDRYGVHRRQWRCQVAALEANRRYDARRAQNPERRYRAIRSGIRRSIRAKEARITELEAALAPEDRG